MKKIVVIAGILFVAGCAVGPKYKRPEVNAPSQYNQTAVRTDSITSMKWWELFQDTVLQGLVRESLKNNRDLLTAMSRVEQSRAILGMNKANYLPGIDYGVRARQTDFGQTGQDATIAFPTDSYSGMLQVSWEIDIWGRLRHSSRAAFADMMANEENRKAIYISLISGVAEQYFALRGTDERLSLARRTLASRREYARILALRFEKGEVSELDKLQADQVAFGAEAQTYQLERQQILVENALSVLLGRGPSAVRRGGENFTQVLPTEIPAGLPSQLLERRPDIRASEQRLIAQTEKVGATVASRFPMLSLTGFMGLASPDLSSITSGDAYVGSLTEQLTGPLFHFNQNKRRVEAEKEAARQAAFQYEQTVIKAFAEVENALVQIRTYKGEYQALSGQVQATQRTLQLSRALYDNGYTSFLQVLDAERQSYEAQYQQSLALQNQLSSTVFLYKALGGGW